MLKHVMLSLWSKFLLYEIVLITTDYDLAKEPMFVCACVCVCVSKDHMIFWVSPKEKFYLVKCLS